MKTLHKTQTRIARRAGAAIALAALAVVALVAAPAAAVAAGNPGPAATAGPAHVGPTPMPTSRVDRHAIVEAGADVYLAPGQSADSIVVLDGDVVVAGTVRHAVVVFGGNVTVRDGARVGSELGPHDASLVVVGGTANVAPGAVVNGNIRTLRHFSASDAVVLGTVAGVGLGIAAIVAAGVALVALFAAPALIAALVVLIVWLVRRDRRTPAEPPLTPTAGAA